MDSDKAIRMAMRIAKADGGPVTAPPDRKLNAQGLYSAAAEAARALPQQKGTPQQMLASLKGVKPDELKWSGAQEKFAGQPSVTKDELAQHFENNLPQIQEHSGNEKFQRYSMTPQNTYGGQRAVKGSYGTNYREKLLALPDKSIDVPAFAMHPDNQKLVQARIEALEEARQVWDSLPAGNRNEHPDYQAAAARANLAQRNEAVARSAYNENIRKTLATRKNFESSHWDSPNVLAHLRMSDWQTPAPASQQPRYPNPPKPDTTAGLSVWNAPNGIKNVPAWSTKTPGLLVHREEGGKPGEYTISHEPTGLAIKRKIQYHHAQDLASRLGPLTDWTQPNGDAIKKVFGDTELERRRREEFDRPPNMPEKVMPKSRKTVVRAPEKNLLLDELQSDWGQKFHSEKKNDDARLLGALNGAAPEAPYITKTEGWTDLGLKRALHEAAHGGYDRLLWTPGEKHADRYNLAKRISSVHYNPVTKTFTAQDLRGTPVVHRTAEPHQLTDLIGKELTQKLLDSRIEPGSGNHNLRGTDLTLGGEGMKGFYNNIVPKRLLALAKEHDPDAKLEHYVDPHKGSAINGFPSLPITEKMRESIKKRGFKAYQRGGSVPMPDPGKSIRKALRIAGTHA